MEVRKWKFQVNECMKGKEMFEQQTYHAHIHTHFFVQLTHTHTHIWLSRHQKHWQKETARHEHAKCENANASASMYLYGPQVETHCEALNEHSFRSLEKKTNCNVHHIVQLINNVQISIVFGYEQYGSIFLSTLLLTTLWIVPAHTHTQHTGRERHIGLRARVHSLALLFRCVFYRYFNRFNTNNQIYYTVDFVTVA